MSQTGISPLESYIELHCRRLTSSAAKSGCSKLKLGQATLTSDPCPNNTLAAFGHSLVKVAGTATANLQALEVSSSACWEARYGCHPAPQERTHRSVLQHHLAINLLLRVTVSGDGVAKYASHHSVTVPSQEEKSDALDQMQTKVAMYMKQNKLDLATEEQLILVDTSKQVNGVRH